MKRLVLAASTALLLGNAGAQAPAPSRVALATQIGRALV